MFDVLATNRSHYTRCSSACPYPFVDSRQSCVKLSAEAGPVAHKPLNDRISVAANLARWERGSERWGPAYAAPDSRWLRIPKDFSFGDCPAGGVFRYSAQSVNSLGVARGSGVGTDHHRVKHVGPGARTH